MSLRRRDERGAMAVLLALLVCFLLIPVAALGTDIGNETARKQDTQNQADYGAFAAAEQLSGTITSGQTPPDSVLTAVMNSMNSNQPQDDGRSCAASSSCITSIAQLKNGNLADGEVQYTSSGVKVTAPANTVNFGLSAIFGTPRATVSSHATVNVFSPGLRTLPMFAVSGCDFGRQTLTDPAHTHDVIAVPTLAFNTEPTQNSDNPTQLTAPLTLTDSANNPVTSFAYQSTGNKITVIASKWSNSSYIGFFRGDDTTPSLVQYAPINPPLTTAGAATSSVTVNVPNAVTQTQTVWYVRVFDGTSATPTASPHPGGQWSTASQALPFRVGNAVLQCAAGSKDGNFGTLKLPRTDQPTSLWMPVNIAAGLQSPLNLEKHQQYTLDSPLGECVGGLNGAVISPVNGANGTPTEHTNCVGTDTGLTANDATQGLITGASGYPGLLTTAGTRSGCDPTGGSNSRTVTLTGNKKYTFDNNVLTCYLINGTTSLKTVSDPNYSGGPAFTKDLVSDPRFVFVPVLQKQPAQGSSTTYSIVDLRPGFITDEAIADSTLKGTHTASADNGVTVDNNGITELKIVFLNINSLPLDQGEAVQKYLGVGKPIVRLID